MRVPSGVTDQYIYFVAVDATDLKTREQGLSGFTVYRSRNGGASTAMTTPTINETDTTNMPGVYELLMDEDMTIDAGDDSQEMLFHITHASMAPVDRTIELYRPKITAGNTLDVTSGGEAGLDFANVALPDGPIPALGIIEGGTAQSANGTTLVGRAAATNDIVRPGHILWAFGSDQGYWQTVMIDSVSGDTFTIAAWPVATPTGTITSRVQGVPQVSSSLPIPANVTQLGGDAQSATDLKDFADAGYDPSTNKVQGVVLTDTVTTYTGNTPQTGDSFARLGAPAGASVSADIAAIEAQTDDIGAAGAGLTALASAANLATVAGYLDTEIAAIKAKTDQLTFTKANEIDANIQSINGVTITGDGQPGTEFDV